MRIALPLSATFLAITACTTLPAKPVVELTEQEARGYDFAKAHCAACHAIMANGSSPNPEAPPFEAVVNTRGLTARTLETFLRDSHNFPGQMAFEIDPAKVDDVTAYMVTLKRADYRPAP
ncbi:MAG TPA: c-type cytochrome [Novosphingobium sp.]|jgi:mono/diheme cytochrome c family protein|nr:c-type cytochrome [Novosphingobium sp.]